MVARSKTRHAKSWAARRATGPKVPNGPILSYTAALGKIIKQTWAIILGGFDIRQDDLRTRTVADQVKVTLYRFIGDHVPAVVDAAAKETSAHNAREMKRVVGIDPRIDPGTAQALEGFRRDNVRLITSVAREQLDRVEEVVSSNYGLRVEDLSKKLQAEFDVTKSRANLIARDQTLKLNGQLTRMRQQSAGIDSYIWTGSRDERERDTHLENEGKTFRWDNPPPETGHPGEDYQCRCVAYPVIPGLDEES